MIHQNPAPLRASFAALVRTTGCRPLLLLDTLQSLEFQHPHCLPVVIVHGDHDAYARVQGICRERGSTRLPVILHATGTGLKRGYPINAGLDYCLNHCPGVEFVFFVDDDDIVYPFFTRMMAAAFLTSGADVVYAASNRREPGQPASVGYVPKPIHHLLRENFITSNSYAVRAAVLRSSGLRMTEDLEYTEDWHFLISMMESGFRFHPLPATLSEFRILSDGNLPQKRDARTWKAISLSIRRHINKTSFPMPGPELVRLSQPGGAAPPTTASTPAATPAWPEIQARLESSEATIVSLRHRIWALENSLSWKWTAPLRHVLSTVMRVPGKVEKRRA